LSSAVKNFLWKYSKIRDEKFRKLYPNIKLQLLLKEDYLKLENKYDFYVISGDWAMSGTVNNKPNLWYIHSPLNELYEFKNYVKKNLMPFWQRPIFEIWAQFNILLNKKYLKNVQKLVCNSENTQKRIKKYYHQEAKIINPPVDTTLFKLEKTENYWLSVNRLSRPKRIEIQLKAFKKIPEENLIIVGSYEQGAKQFEKYKKFLEEIKPLNVKIVNWSTERELKNLYAKCKGFITTSMDEDFGMTPIEAMASGKPVIAPNEGGYRETIENGKTGILINNINENKIIEAIKQINKELREDPKKYEENCINQAKKFDLKEFITKIKNEIN